MSQIPLFTLPLKVWTTSKLTLTLQANAHFKFNDLYFEMCKIRIPIFILHLKTITFIYPFLYSFYIFEVLHL